ncbi:hypothetical protein T4A_5376 [Trichinella pseudospiralis]|uniref:Uncharacterized protein n=1 Tax=Trichinella pseudospiralis TaxID=6337 RepID=A0A0V1EGC7_TRIPS|nr:hypothetical protein T4A_5376 [Trichinella pseudospiralis]
MTILLTRDIEFIIAEEKTKYNINPLQLKTKYQNDYFNEIIIILMKMIFLNSSEFSFGIALANFRRLKPHRLLFLSILHYNNAAVSTVSNATTTFIET